MDTKTVSCQKCLLTFCIDSADSEFYKALNVPEPTWCPQCRLQRRLSWINLRKLSKRKLTNSDKEVVSMYSENKPFNIVEDKEWWSDTYDMTEYGIEYDFTKPFFQQFRELMERAPLPHLQRNFSTFENSDYCNGATGLKNCYLLMAADQDENCYYGYTVEATKDSMDLAFVTESELCYEGVNLRNCFKAYYSNDCENCNEVLFSSDCVGCTDCFGCINLKNKSYYIFNEPYSKDEYLKKIKEFDLSSYKEVEGIKEKVKSLFEVQPHRFMHGRNNIDVSGEYIDQSKNVRDSFTVSKCEDSRYCHFLRHIDAGTTQSYDYTLFGLGADQIYECSWVGLQSSLIRFSHWNYGARDLQYSFGCHSSESLFGCIGIRKKRYCILNKQYTKEEYEALVPKIIAHMNELPYLDTQGRTYRYGEFFPTELSPFAYNETLAQEYIPITAEEAEKDGYNWITSSDTTIGKTTHWNALPDSISDLTDDIATTPILCRAFDEDPEQALQHNCSKIFKPIPQEINFYKTYGIPLPRYCQNSRHYARIKMRNPLQLTERTCECNQGGQHAWHRTDSTPNSCPNVFKTAYAKNRKESPLCEECYSTIIT